MRKIPIRKHFAVFGGAGGFTGIVRSRAEAARLTRGVVNAKSKAFRTEVEATRYINYYLRKAGAGRLTFEDLQAAAAAPDEVREAEAVEEAKAAEDDPRGELGEEFWSTARERAKAQGVEGHQLFKEICRERGLTAQNNYEEFCRLAKICYGPVDERQL